MVIKLVSSDLNGTLVHQNTMGDMIRLYKKQINGTVTIKKAFSIAGPLTKGLTLRQAIEYTKIHMKYVDGFKKFIDDLRNAKIPLVINSTAYSVTIYSIIEQVGKDKIHGQICNSLKFVKNGDSNSPLKEDELKRLVAKYFENPNSTKNNIYDRIQATGVVELGIQDESDKAKLIISYVKKHFPAIKPDEIAHIGDSMGDSRGIYDIAKQGGLGIAFNYNGALEKFLKEKLASEKISGKIVLIEPKSEFANLMRIVPHLLDQ